MRDWLEKVKHWTLCLYLMIIPLASAYGMNDRAVQEHTYQYMTIGILALFVGNFLLTSFIILNLVSYIAAGESVGSMQVLNITFGCLLFRFVQSYFKKRAIEPYFKPLLWLTFITLTLTVLQVLNLDPIFSPQDGAGNIMNGPHGLPTGFFGINMAHGMFLNIAGVILSFFNPLLALCMALPIAMLRSSAVFLSFGVSVLFITWFRFRRYFIYCLGAMFLFAGVGIFHDQSDDPGSFRSRFPVWHMTVKYVLTSPARLIGYGPDSFRNEREGKEFTFFSDESFNAGVMISDGKGNGNFQYYSPNRKPVNIQPIVHNGKMHIAFWDNPHNEYLQMLFQYGIIGFLLLIGLMREMWYRFYFARKTNELVTVTACILVFFVSSLTQFPLGLARIGYLFPIFLGMFYSLTESNA